MKKEIVRLLALLVFGAAALTGCSIENQGRHGKYNNNRNHRDHHDYHNNDHHYNNGY
ncbi:ABC-type oligopeptide transport system substrate-binding subunit [Mucilaginibacter sp. UYP25]|uniref:hypothetical protein n=1 Tax=unclassified Mucilaginibacter TaxID=2617802 RepID=UPI0033977F31